MVPMLAELPAQIVLSVPAFAEGSGFTFTVTLSYAMHALPLIELRTIYVVVVVGATVFIAVVDEYPDGEDVHL